MKDALLRSVASTLAALAIIGLGELVFFGAMCPAHHE